MSKKLKPRTVPLCPICGKVPFYWRNRRYNVSRVFIGGGGQYRSNSGARGPRGVRSNRPNRRPLDAYCWHNPDNPRLAQVRLSAELNHGRKGATRRGDKRRPERPGR